MDPQPGPICRAEELDVAALLGRVLGAPLGTDPDGFWLLGPGGGKDGDCAECAAGPGGDAGVPSGVGGWGGGVLCAIG